jgi:hypothetical protein
MQTQLPSGMVAKVFDCEVVAAAYLSSQSLQMSGFVSDGCYLGGILSSTLNCAACAELDDSMGMSSITTAKINDINGLCQ